MGVGDACRPVVDGGFRFNAVDGVKVTEESFKEFDVLIEISALRGLCSGTRFGVKCNKEDTSMDVFKSNSFLVISSAGDLSIPSGWVRRETLI